jgi:5-methylcytosine-specific restriction enzyme A
LKIPASGLLTGRAVPEWIGKTPDSKPPKAVVDRVFLRQMGRCALSDAKIMPGDKTHTDHKIPLKDGGENRESNLQIVLEVPHREKTKAENAARDKEERMRLKHHGLWPKSKAPLRSRGFARTRDYRPDPDT